MKQSEKTLILITNHFPYGSGEAFLESEISHLTLNFNNVIIIARDVKSTALRAVNESITTYRINPESSPGEKVLTVGLYIKKIKKVFSYVTDEIQFIKAQGLKLSTGIISQMIHDLTKALTTSHHLEKIIRSEGIQGTVVLYSYWMNNSALATTLINLKSLNIKCITRIHGGDVYEYRNPLNYLSFRRAIVENADAIFAVSQNGQQHLQKKLFNQFDSKIRLSRLGTQSKGIQPENNVASFRILSCSFILEVKRLHLLIEALTFVNLKVEWIHIGDGPLKNEMEKLAIEKLTPKKNISFSFKGSITNKELLQYYEQNYVHLFVNTSSSEGIPVTMMEAQSFGIPIVAPCVGGIPEIVSNENGRLLAPDASAADFGSKITEVLSLSPSEYQSLRNRAKTSWETQYNAERNFSNFVAQINAL